MFAWIQELPLLWKSTGPLDDVGKMTLALLLGGLIGLERRRQAHAAGMRTQMLVSSASCLIMLVSIHVAGKHSDPGRIAAQVVTGIGFLGAGAIIKFGMSVRGLTTAASIWASAAIGLAVGAGFIVGALGLTVLVVAALLLFDPLESWLTGDWDLKKIRVTGSDGPELMSEVDKLVRKHGMDTKEMGLKRDLEQKTVEIDLAVLCRRATVYSEFMQEVSKISGVTKIQIE